MDFDQFPSLLIEQQSRTQVVEAGKLLFAAIRKCRWSNMATPHEEDLTRSWQARGEAIVGTGALVSGQVSKSTDTLQCSSQRLA